MPSNMLMPTREVAPQVATGLAQPAAASMQKQQTPTVTATELSAPQVMQPPHSAVSQPFNPQLPSVTQGMPNSRVMMDPMLLQQIMQTMLGGPSGGAGGGLGALMQPQAQQSQLQAIVPQLTGAGGIING